MDKLKQFHEYATERALKTVAQTAIAMITASAALSVTEVDWIHVVGVAALAGIMSLLTSVLAYDKEGPKQK
jgi:diacylglycerol kinase